MAFALHTVQVPDGAPPIISDRFILGTLRGVRVPEIVGAITAVTVTTPGSNYTNVPAINAVTGAAGSGAILFGQMVAQTFTFTTAGTSYAPGDLLTISQATGSHPVVQITGTKVVSDAVVSAGAGYAVSDIITFGLGGSQAQPQLQVSVATVGALGALTAVNIVNAGVFTTNATPLAQVNTTGVGLGATLSVTYGAATGLIEFPGFMSGVATGAVSQSSASGNGTGAIGLMTYGLGDVGITSNGAAYTPDVQISIGAPNAGGLQAAAIATTDVSGSTVVMQIRGLTGLPTTSAGVGTYGVWAMPSEPYLTLWTDGKTATGFDVGITPTSTGAAVGGTIDFLFGG